MDSKYTHLVGRVGTKPEAKTTSGGSRLKEFRLAVDGKYDPVTKSAPTEWFTVTVWEPLSKVVKFGTGGRVWVAGEISSWMGESGERKTITAKEIGLVEKLIPGYEGASESVPEGVTLDEEDGEW